MIRIFKESRELEVWVHSAKTQRFDLFRSYPVRKCSGDLEPKLREGDRQAPEGFYAVTSDLMNPRSRFHLSFNIGYPNAYDRNHGRTGSLIMVHGGSASIGCFAMGNDSIEEIYALADAALRNGQKSFGVHVFPFCMTASNLRRHGDSQWAAFWRNLKEGHDFFERDGMPPEVTVVGGEYAFQE